MDWQEADSYAVPDCLYDFFPKVDLYQTTSASTSISAFLPLNEPQFQIAQLPTGVVLPIHSFHLPRFSDINASSERCYDNTNLQFELHVTEAPYEDHTTSVSTTTSTPLSSPRIPQSPASLSPDKSQLQELIQAPQWPQLSTNVVSPNRSMFLPEAAPFSSVKPPCQQHCAPTNQSNVNDNDDDADVQKPGNTSTLADTGHITCPYDDGCNLRFETELDMKKHKAAHLQPVVRSFYECKQIHPMTGKRCTGIFRRPFELTRHEEHVHGKKQKVRCSLCEKKYSRKDTLKRHWQTAHPQDFAMLASSSTPNSPTPQGIAPTKRLGTRRAVSSSQMSRLQQSEEVPVPPPIPPVTSPAVYIPHGPSVECGYQLYLSSIEYNYASCNDAFNAMKYDAAVKPENALSCDIPATDLYRTQDPYGSNIYGVGHSTEPPNYLPSHGSYGTQYPVNNPTQQAVPLSTEDPSSVGIVAVRPKPQCWEHGCNGRQFSTSSNLLRHQRERSGNAAEYKCTKCSAVFLRSTARDNHVAGGNCKKARCWWQLQAASALEPER